MDKIIIDHNKYEYQVKNKVLGDNRWNGAYYYSKEIVDYFIPNIVTDRNWVTVNIPPQAVSHSIVFIHNNLHPEWYDWLSDYDDLILVCGVPETCDKVKHLGTPIYLPLSIDVEEVAKYKAEKTKNVAFAGRREKRYGTRVPHSVDFIEGLNRPNFLSTIAQYRKLFAVGRVALEGKVLGCQILMYDKRFPDPEVWQVLDSREAAQMLQVELDKIDKR